MYTGKPDRQFNSRSTRYAKRRAITGPMVYGWLLTENEIWIYRGVKARANLTGGIDVDCFGNVKLDWAELKLFIDVIKDS